MHLTHKPAAPLLGLYPTERRTYRYAKAYVQMLTGALSVIARNNPVPLDE